MADRETPLRETRAGQHGPGHGAPASMPALAQEVFDALLADERRDRALVQHDQDVVCTCDADGRLLGINGAAAAAFGLPEAELLGRRLDELIVTEDQPALEETVAEALRAGVGIGMARLAVGAEPPPWYRWEVRPTDRHDDGVRPLQVFGTDISRLKEVEAAFSALQPRVGDRYYELLTLFATAPVGLFAVDRELRLLRANRWMRGVDGLAPDRHAGRHIGEALPNLAADIASGCEQVLATGDVLLDRPVRVTLPDATRDYEMSFCPLRNAEGERRGVAIVMVDVTARDATQAALRQTRDQLRAVLDSAPVVVWALDADGLFTLSDGSGLARFGLRPGEVVGRSVFELYASYPDVLAGVRRALAGAAFTTQSLVAGVNWQVRYTPLRDAEGAVRGTLGVAYDISERVQSAARLQASHERLQTTLDNMLEGCAIIDFDMRYVYVNDALLVHALRPREELVGQRFEVAFPDLVGTTFEATLRLALEERVPQMIELDYQPPTGGLRWYTLSFQPVPEGVFVLSLDVSDRKQAEFALRESDRQTRELLQNIALVAVTLDEAGRIKFCNDYLLELSGYRREEVLGRDYFALFVPPEQQAERRDHYRHASQTAAGDMRREQEMLCRDGQRRLIAWNTSPVHDSEGQVVGVTSIGQDVTEQRQLEAQVRHAQKMEAVGELAGGVAHDFNNILTAILGYAELAKEELRSTPTTPGALAEAVDEIERAGQRASTLTRQLLAFSRRQVVKPSRLDLNSVVAGLEKMIKRLIEARIHLRLRLAEHLPVIWMDAGQIEQVVLNLVVNARDAMPEGGDLTLSTAIVTPDETLRTRVAGLQAERYVRLSVADTGIGMDEATADRVFEPFYTTKPLGRGTGLGLATVYGIIKQTGGVITLESAVNRGTRFDLYFPCVDFVAPTADARAEHDVPRGTGRVLLVEDEREVRELARRMLEYGGYEVTVAATAGQAYEFAASEPPAPILLITDVILPDENGRQVAEQLHAVWPDLQVLYISGYPSNVVAQQGVLDDGVELLEKPFGRRALLERVQAILTRRA